MVDNVTYIKYTPINVSPFFSLTKKSWLSKILPEITLETDLALLPEILLEDLLELELPIWTFSSSINTLTTSRRLPTNINLQGWDLNKTLLHLREHANDTSTHYCARSVRLALEAGGLTGFRVPNAKDEIKLNTLESIGFKKIAEATDNKTTAGYTPLAGDVAISYENGNHAAMYDGSRWISDFKLNNLDVYNSLKNTKSAIYRRVGESQLLALKKFGGIFKKAREVSLKYHNK